jgi:hypothetical protein
MGLRCTVGGARGTFDGPFAEEVAILLDQAFGAEREWEDDHRSPFGELDRTDWAAFQAEAVSALGAENLGNLLALGAGGRGVYLPANLPAVSLPTRAGGPLRCASLPGLRRELFELAERWDLPVDDEALTLLLEDEEDSAVAPAPEHLAFARLMLAANEAMRRDCPLWLVG